MIWVHSDGNGWLFCVAIYGCKDGQIRRFTFTKTQMISLEDHKKSYIARVRQEKENRRVEAERMLRKALGELMDYAEDFGPWCGDMAWVKFKNHRTIYVDDMDYGMDSTQGYGFTTNPQESYPCDKFAQTLIKAEIPNTWWNRLTGKYKI